MFFYPFKVIRTKINSFHYIQYVFITYETSKFLALLVLEQIIAFTKRYDNFLILVHE